MAEKGSTSKRLTMIWSMVGGAVALLAITGWALINGSAPAEATSPLPPELTVEGLKRAADDPSALRKTIRHAIRDENLSDEQRRQAFQNMREVRRSEMAARVNEYFDAPDDQKNAVLDKHIDEFQKRIKAWQQARKEDDKERERDRQKFRQLFGTRSKGERKAQSESRNPDQSARTMAYFSAIRGRMKQRGIKMPSFGRGRGGAARRAGRRRP